MFEISKIKDLSLLLKGNFGLEREVLRVDKKGNISQKPHPFKNNKYIGLDFSESQIEIITPSLDSIEKTKLFLDNITNIINQSLEDEYLWNYSMPPKIENEDDIKIADLSEEKTEYRNYLAKTYGKKKQVISGLHYNFSFDEAFLKQLYKELNFKGGFKEFKNEVYLKIARQYISYEWLIIYLLGNTPVADITFTDSCCKDRLKRKNDLCLSKFSKSIRSTECGYSNLENYVINYRNVDKYVNEINSLVEKGKIINNKEYYNSIRLKNSNGFEKLKSEGVEYIELRNIDICPFNKSGVDIEGLKFIHIFLIYLLFSNEEFCLEEEGETITNNKKYVSFFGDNDSLKITSSVGIEKPINILCKEVLEKMKYFYKEKINTKEFDNLIDKIFTKKDNSNLIREEILKQGYQEYILELSKKYKKESLDKPYLLEGFEDMELSTQILIKDAYRKGYGVDILDRKENFISISNDYKKEYIVQATKTSLDNYATILAMENKVVTKKILSENNIRVASGDNYINIDNAKKYFYLYKGRDIVIKPKSTNFGLGISILKGNYTQEEFNEGLEIAFKEDTDILIEEFLKGKEYRIFTIGKEVVGILHRIPANVKGNGIFNIIELVFEKNKDSLRGKGYKTPLEKINLGEEEKLFLKLQNLDFNYIPKKNEIIYLRENSNISTGGDSIDFTDEVDISYKELAIKSSKSIGAEICGVDMMIEDINTPATNLNYGIVELNFNPAIHIHCYPFKGKNRKLGEKILSALFK